MKRPKSSICESDDAFIERIRRDHPEWLDMTAEELAMDQCRLEAEIQDRDRRHAELYRSQGFLAIEDAHLLSSITKALPRNLTMKQAMETLRAKPWRGHRQQEALDTWDAHYAGRDVAFPVGTTVDRLEELFETLEAARG